MLFVNRWILSKLNRCIDDCNQGMKDYKFGAAVEAGCQVGDRASARADNTVTCWPSLSIPSEACCLRRERCSKLTNSLAAAN
eukprot:SAG22_NODE_7_length_40155_cov_25.241356_6_plen_82_part_00